MPARRRATPPYRPPSGRTASRNTTEQREPVSHPGHPSRQGPGPGIRGGHQLSPPLLAQPSTNLAAAATLGRALNTRMIARRLPPSPQSSRTPPQVTSRMAVAVLGAGSLMHANRALKSCVRQNLDHCAPQTSAWQNPPGELQGFRAPFSIRRKMSQGGCSNALEQHHVRGITGSRTRFPGYIHPPGMLFTSTVSSCSIFGTPFIAARMLEGECLLATAAFTCMSRTAQ